MKKLIAILLILVSFSFLFSCNEEETPEENVEQVPGPENNWGDFDGNGTTDSLEKDPPPIPI